MESEYLEESRPIKRIGNILSRFTVKQDTPPIKKRGGLNEITELRGKTAKLLNVPIAQVYGLTRGWSASELRDTLKTCNDFVNPPALWWKLYKKNKTSYGRTNKTALPKDRKKGRESEREERQSPLF